MSVWFDGKYYPDEVQLFTPQDRGILLGDGLFETILCLSGRPIFFEEHFQRLKLSALRLGFSMPYEGKEILPIIEKLLLENQLTLRASLRITLSRGVGPRGLLPPPASQATPHCLITANSAAAPSTIPLKITGVTVRRNEGSPAAQLKTLAYIDNILAKLEAHAQGADEALMLNNQGDVACLSVANIFCLTEQGSLLTPALDCGILPGIVRAIIISAAQSLGIKVKQGAFKPETFLSGLVFASNSLMGLRRCDAGNQIQSNNLQQDLFETLASHYEMLVEQSL